MIHDDSRNSLHLVERQLGDDASLKYIDGVAMHWYEDGAYSAKFLQYAKTPKKDTFILYTESCFCKHIELSRILSQLMIFSYFSGRSDDW